MAAVALSMGAVGVSMLKEHEGLRFRAYLDPVGIPTICYGHTGPEVRLGLTYTREQCESTLRRDIQTHRAGLARCVTRPLTPNQWDALTSFAFNIGVNKACKSTLVRYVNQGSFISAANEFSRWKYGSVRGRAVVLPGLVKRRAAEAALFRSEERLAGSPEVIKQLVAFDS